jgi:hypothetical protein
MFVVSLGTATTARLCLRLGLGLALRLRLLLNGTKGLPIFGFLNLLSGRASNRLYPPHDGQRPTFLFVLRFHLLYPHLRQVTSLTLARLPFFLAIIESPTFAADIWKMHHTDAYKYCR